MSGASRTMLFNIHTLGWDPELLQLLSIPSRRCCRACGRRVGSTG
ncbi:MAG: hypothetical protein U0Q11_06925 [Vicinamibacterales bacterium]